MSRYLPALLGMILLAAPLLEPATAAPDPLIPRELLFGNPTRVQPKLRPDGGQIAFIAPEEGVMNIWLAEGTDTERASAVTHDRGRGIQGFSWAYTNQHILYSQDRDGDENYHVYCLDVTSGEVKDLTPIDGVQARIEAVSYKHPEEILVGLNERDPRLHDVHRVNLRTGEHSLVLRNEGYVGFVTDDDLTVRAGARIQMAAGGMSIVIEDLTAGAPAKVLLEIAGEDAMTTGLVALDNEAPIAYLLDSRGRNTAALVAMSLRTGKTRLIAEDPRCDVSGALLDPKTNKPLAYAATYERTEWKALDPAVGADLNLLRGLDEGEIAVASFTLDNRQWIVAFVGDAGPVRYYLFDRDTRKSRFLFCHRPELETAPLSKMHAVRIPSRDGLELVSYLTLPRWADQGGAGRTRTPLPTVLWIHGGPWTRDSWGYNPVHQWLANRGYAVLSVNYRGSTGFGKEFINAANREWGGKMHDDVIDAACWLVEKGVADPRRIAISGGSYGGYETLVGMTMTPFRFACGVDLCGPSNLITFLENVPEYWVPVLPLLDERIGESRTEEGRAALLARSPLSFVDRIRRPLLIGQGANDPRVKQSESDQIVQAMEARGIPVAYLRYADEGHGFVRPANSLSFWAAMEAFLATNIGGRCEPVGPDCEGSSVEVVTGSELLTTPLDSGGEAESEAPDPGTAPPSPGSATKPGGKGYAYPPVGGVR